MVYESKYVCSVPLMTDPHLIRVRYGATGPVISSGKPADSKPLIEHLTPTGRRALAFLIALFFLDLGISSEGTYAPRNLAVVKAPAAREVFSSQRSVASAHPFSVAPLIAAGSAAVTPAPAPGTGDTTSPATPTTPSVAVAAPSPAPLHEESMALREMPAPMRLVDLEIPGDVALGSNPLPHDSQEPATAVAAAPDADESATPLQETVAESPKLAHPHYRNRHPAVTHLVAMIPAAISKPAAPAAPSFFHDAPSVFSMPSMLEAKASRPAFLFNN
jgi:hypothetical protein